LEAKLSLKDKNESSRRGFQIGVAFYRKEKGNRSYRNHETHEGRDGNQNSFPREYGRN
jgi:hypothetical protein